MDRNHQLEAPNNDELKNIEQVADHSELSTIYHKAKDQWEGELVSEEERARRNQEKYDTMSFGIRKEFWIIGILIPLPIVIAACGITIIMSLIINDPLYVEILVVPAIFAFLIWSGLSFLMVRKTSAIFYKNALQASPYTVVLLTLLALSIVPIYGFTMPIHTHSAVIATAIVGGISIVWSILVSALLLILWTTTRATGRVKLGIITAFACLLGLLTAIFLLP